MRVLNVVNARVGLLGKTLLKQRHDRNRRRRGQVLPLGFAAENRRNAIRHRIASERLASDERLVQHAAKSPDVRAGVDRKPTGLFGAHIRGGTQDHPFACGLDGGEKGRCRHQAAIGRLRQTEVQHLHDLSRSTP